MVAVLLDQTLTELLVKKGYDVTVLTDIPLMEHWDGWNVQNLKKISNLFWVILEIMI